MVRRSVENIPARPAALLRARPLTDSPQSAGQSPEETVTSPVIVPLFLICLLIPGSLNVAGQSLSPYRILLLVLFIPLSLRWISGKAGRITAVDIFILLNCLWMFLVLLVLHGKGQIPRGGSLFVELFGGYLVGRTLIQNALDHKKFFNYYVLFLVVIAPLAVFEMLTGINIPRMIFENVFSIPPRQPNLGRRLGLIRSQGPFEHPILLGLFCSLGVANVFYIYKGKLVQQFWRTAFLVFLTFTTLSSAPLIAVGLQLMICTYDRILQFIKGRWVLLAALALTGLGLLKVASQFEIVDFIINNLTFNPVTGEARIEVFTYGIIEVWRHPVFGIGNNDWVRPYWHAHPSVDNFWLAMTMRYGIPTFFCFVAGILSSFYLITSANGLSETEGRYRTGYLIALVGLIVVLGTVSMWGATSVFVMAYLGAGNWFHNSGGPASSRPQRVRDRPLTTTSRREAPVQKTATIAPPHRRTMNSLRQTRRGS